MTSLRVHHSTAPVDTLRIAALLAPLMGGCAAGAGLTDATSEVEERPLPAPPSETQGPAPGLVYIYLADGPEPMWYVATSEHEIAAADSAEGVVSQAARRAPRLFGVVPLGTALKIEQRILRRQQRGSVERQRVRNERSFPAYVLTWPPLGAAPDMRRLPLRPASTGDRDVAHATPGAPPRELPPLPACLYACSRRLNIHTDTFSDLYSQPVGMDTIRAMHFAVWQGTNPDAPHTEIFRYILLSGHIDTDGKPAPPPDGELVQVRTWLEEHIRPDGARYQWHQPVPIRTMLDAMNDYSRGADKWPYSPA